MLSEGGRVCQDCKVCEEVMTGCDGNGLGCDGNGLGCDGSLVGWKGSVVGCEGVMTGREETVTSSDGATDNKVECLHGQFGSSGVGIHGRTGPMYVVIGSMNVLCPKFSGHSVTFTVIVTVRGPQSAFSVV